MDQPHILLVDDDLYVVESLKASLEHLGYRVTPAFGFGQAKEKLRKRDKIDLMILDYLLPDGSGTDLLQSLGNEPGLQKPPVILSSGILDPKAAVWEEIRNRLPIESRTLIHAYVSKPYTLDAMDLAVHEVLGGDYQPGKGAPKRAVHE